MQPKKELSPPPLLKPFQTISKWSKYSTKYHNIVKCIGWGGPVPNQFGRSQNQRTSPIKVSFKGLFPELSIISWDWSQIRIICLTRKVSVAPIMHCRGPQISDRRPSLLMEQFKGQKINRHRLPKRGKKVWSKSEASILIHIFSSWSSNFPRR